MSAIKSPKDFWTGVIYLVLGGAAVFLAWEYGLGSATRMGPGYFPSVLGGLLLLFGAVAIVRSFLVPGTEIGGFAWKAAVLVIAGTLLFGFLIRTAGLPIAMVVLVMLSAYASTKFALEWKALAGLVALVAFCALVFVKALGVPMPLLGSWFGG